MMLGDKQPELRKSNSQSLTKLQVVLLKDCLLFLDCKTDGRVRGLGRNKLGQFGVGKVDSDTRFRITSAALKPVDSRDEYYRFQGLEGAESACFGIDSSGDLYSWGCGISSVSCCLLGYPKKGSLASYHKDKKKSVYIEKSPWFMPRPYKILLEPVEKIKVSMISASSSHVSCVTEQGQIYGWGSSDHGVLGVYAQHVPWPRRIEGLKGMNKATSVKTGYQYSLILTSDDMLYSIGSNLNLCLGVSDELEKTDIPMFVSDNILMMDAGDTVAAAVDLDGKVLTWGVSYEGVLGSGPKETYRGYPQEISFSGYSVFIKHVAVSRTIGVAISDDNRVYEWGSAVDEKRIIFTPEVCKVSKATHVCLNNIGTILYDDRVRAFYLRGPSALLPYLSQSKNSDHLFTPTSWRNLLDMFYNYGLVQTDQSNNNNVETKSVIAPDTEDKKRNGDYDIDRDQLIELFDSDSENEFKANTSFESIYFEFEESDYLVQFYVTTTRFGELWKLRGEKVSIGHHPRSFKAELIFNKHHVLEICCGDSFQVLRTRDGLVFSWGQPNQGRLGVLGVKSATHPIKVDLPDRCRKISCTKTSSFALLSNKDLMVWGTGAGIPHHSIIEIPTKAQIPIEVDDIACGPTIVVVYGNKSTYISGVGYGDGHNYVSLSVLDGFEIKSIRLGGEAVFMLDYQGGLWVTGFSKLFNQENIFQPVSEYRAHEKVIGAEDYITDLGNFSGRYGLFTSKKRDSMPWVFDLKLGTLFSLKDIVSEQTFKSNVKVYEAAFGVKHGLIISGNDHDVLHCLNFPGGINLRNIKSMTAQELEQYENLIEKSERTLKAVQVETSGITEGIEANTIMSDLSDEDGIKKSGNYVTVLENACFDPKMFLPKRLFYLDTTLSKDRSKKSRLYSIYSDYFQLKNPASGLAESKLLKRFFLLYLKQVDLTEDHINSAETALKKKTREWYHRSERNQKILCNLSTSLGFWSLLSTYFEAVHQKFVQKSHALISAIRQRNNHNPLLSICKNTKLKRDLLIIEVLKIQPAYLLKLLAVICRSSYLEKPQQTYEDECKSFSRKELGEKNNWDLYQNQNDPRVSINSTKRLIRQLYFDADYGFPFHFYKSLMRQSAMIDLKLFQSNTKKFHPKFSVACAVLESAIDSLTKYYNSTTINDYSSFQNEIFILFVQECIEKNITTDGGKEYEPPEIYQLYMNADSINSISENLIGWFDFLVTIFNRIFLMDHFRVLIEEATNVFMFNFHTTSTENLIHLDSIDTFDIIEWLQKILGYSVLIPVLYDLIHFQLSKYIWKKMYADMRPRPQAREEQLVRAYRNTWKKQASDTLFYSNILLGLIEILRLFPSYLIGEEFKISRDKKEKKHHLSSMIDDGNKLTAALNLWKEKSFSILRKFMWNYVKDFDPYLSIFNTGSDYLKHLSHICQDTRLPFGTNQCINILRWDYCLTMNAIKSRKEEVAVTIHDSLIETIESYSFEFQMPDNDKWIIPNLEIFLKDFRGFLDLGMLNILYDNLFAVDSIEDKVILMFNEPRYEFMKGNEVIVIDGYTGTPILQRFASTVNTAQHHTIVSMNENDKQLKKGIALPTILLRQDIYSKLTELCLKYPESIKDAFLYDSRILHKDDDLNYEKANSKFIENNKWFLRKIKTLQVDDCDVELWKDVADNIDTKLSDYPLKTIIYNMLKELIKRYCHDVYLKNATLHLEVELQNRKKLEETVKPLKEFNNSLYDTLRTYIMKQEHNRNSKLPLFMNWPKTENLKLKDDGSILLDNEEMTLWNIDKVNNSILLLNNDPDKEEGTRNIATQFLDDLKKKQVVFETDNDDLGFLNTVLTPNPSVPSETNMSHCPHILFHTQCPIELPPEKERGRCARLFCRG